MMHNKRNYILMLIMMSVAILPILVKPTHRIADEGQAVDLEKIIPKQFNDWQQLEMVAQIVNPEMSAALREVYAQTLSRTYANAKGERIMLSIAYGKDQSDSVSAHAPEGCYSGQGFAVQSIVQGRLNTTYGDIPVSRLLASKSDRIEPITYWLTTGNKVAYPGWDTKKLKLQYALERSIPDGLLMRVSNVVASSDTQDVNAAYQLQTRFAADLIAGVSPSQRLRLAGLPS